MGPRPSPTSSYPSVRHTSTPQGKFGVAPGPEMERMQATLVHEYAQGLAWVMAYYYDGCASWNWYYPFHYAPFASGE